MKRIFIYFVLALFENGAGIAQIPDTLWSSIHDITEDVDIGQCIEQTSDGGYIITGSCVPDGLISFTDVFLLKTDALGNIEWTKYFNHNFFENGMSVGQCYDGGFIIGAIRQMGSYPFIEPPVSDAWIIKTDANGDTVWDRSIDHGGNEYCTSIKQTADSCFVFTGAINSESCGPTWEVNELTSPDSGRTWLVKVNRDGTIVWDKAFVDRSNGNYIIQTTDGGFLITGCLFPDPQSNRSDMLLIKTDYNGDTLWTKAIGTQNYDVGFCVKETQDGFLISGQTKSAGQSYDALLIKTDLNGEVIWSKVYGGQLSDAAFNVDVLNNGYYIAGSTNGTWWITGSADMWIFKTDTNGNFLWERIYDINTNDNLYSGTICEDGGYVVTGITSDGFGGDLWLAKMEPEITNISDDNKENIVSNYILHQNYPNPFNPSTKIAFSVPDNEVINLTVYSSLGQKLVVLMNRELPAGEYEIEFDGTGLSSGIYFYQLKTEKFIATRKMLLIR